MKKVMIPTDFSACARAAENYGMALAKQIKAELVFLHIIITPVNWSKLTTEQEHLFPETKEKIATAKKELKSLVEKAEASGVTASKLLVFSFGNEKIHKYIESEKIDMIVMGSHGQYGFKEHILGTNTYSVLRRAEIPVVVVKEENVKNQVKDLVLATNFKEKTGKSFKMLEQLSERLGAKLHVLYVNTPTYFLETNDIMSLGKSFLQEFGSYNYDIHIIDAFKEERGIMQFAEKLDADGMAVITFGKSDLMQYFSPSITENLIAMSDHPVISIKKGK